MSTVAINAIRFYQHRISSKTPPCCKYSPTCSHYAVDAINRYGLLSGMLRAAWRIARCNPFSRGGHDPA